MTDFIADILDFMTREGCYPKGGQIIIDNEKHYFHPNGHHKKSGVYCFKETEYGGIIGWFMDYREGILHKYCSKNNKELSPKERAELKARIRNEQAARRVRLARIRTQVKEFSNKLWNKATPATNHPYLEAKGIDGKGAKIWRDILLVPAFDKDKTISSLQFINASGEKRFKKDGGINGCYGSIGSDPSIIYISEGFATAKSVYKAVAPCVSVWAFNAGNMLEVAKIIRDKFPDSRIVIAADNDYKTTNAKGEKINPGIEKGYEAAKAIAGDFIFPEQIEGTDFNDLEKEQGLDILKQRLSEAKAFNLWGETVNILLGQGVASGQEMISQSPDDGFAPPISEEDYQSYFNSVPLHDYEYASREEKAVQDWQDLTICDSKGNLVKTSLKNTVLLLQHKPKYKNVFRYNEFSHKIYVTRAPIWEDESKFMVHELNDVDISEAASSIEYEGLSPDINRVHNAIKVVANKNKFHPAQDYFNALEWDGVPRLDRWLTYYMGAEDDDSVYLSAIGKKWLVAGVKRVFRAGCKFDHVLIIEGEQGKGKSMALEELATFGDDVKQSYFTDSISISDIHNKDTIMKLQGSIIVELGELAGFSKKDDNEMKSWITNKIDEARLPYARTPTKFARQFILSATTNGYEYLKDATGNRRYWPFKATAIDLEALRKDKKQLWAEAVQLYKQGMYLGLSDEETELAKAAQHKRMNVDVWQDDVERVIDEFTINQPITIEKIMKEMGLGLRDRDYKSQRRIANILRMIGYENIVRKVDGRSVRYWAKAEQEQDMGGW